MTLATDLYLRLSGEETLVNGQAGLLQGLVGSLSKVVGNLIEESPSLAKFFPVPGEIASLDLLESPVELLIGGYLLGIEVVGLLNKPFSLVEGEEVENKLHLIVDLSIVREGTDLPFVSTLGISQVGGLWEEFIPSVENFFVYETIDNLETWFEGFLRAGLLEHTFTPGAFEYDSEVLVEDLSEDLIGDSLN